jgi:S1-C subfamily serine protease
MNSNLRWKLVTLALVAHGVLLQPTARADDPIKLVAAFSRPLLKFSNRSRQTVLTRLLEESELRMPDGKRIEVEKLPMTSEEMIAGVLNGTLKAHILVPTSHVYLELADREWSLRTGKALTAEQYVLTHQPHVLAVRRPMAEAMGWPAKEIGWAEVIEVARGGWKTAGHSEWGTLRLVFANPDFSDAGLHAMMSVALGTLGKSKGITSEDTAGPAVAAAFKAIDNAVVWYPLTTEDFLCNEALEVPPRCHMTFLPEHLMLALNERSIRRKAPPDWVAIYPTKGTIVDNVTAAVVQREWVTPEQREAANAVLKQLRTPEVQKRIMAMGYRPVLPGLALDASLAEAMGIDPSRPREAVDMPPTEVILDCLAAWKKQWKARNAEGTESIVAAATTPAPAPSLQTTSHLTPVVQCVHVAKPSIITIRNPSTNKVSGTGVLIDARGYAITAAHVVRDEKNLPVNFLDSDDKVLDSEVVWKDADQDLAIVRIQAPRKYPAVKFADPTVLEAGETVVVIGDPLGYQGSVTMGIISAMGRQITMPSGAVIGKLIQTDAAVNPGNSGGPLLDANGDLIGIVIAIRSDATNIAFAIPVDRVRARVKEHVPN